MSHNGCGEGDDGWRGAASNPARDYDFGYGVHGGGGFGDGWGHGRCGGGGSDGGGAGRHFAEPPEMAQ